MDDINIIFSGVGPHVELNDTNTSLKGFDDGHNATIATYLVSGKIRVVSGVYEIMS